MNTSQAIVLAVASVVIGLLLGLHLAPWWNGNEAGIDALLGPHADHLDELADTADVAWRHFNDLHHSVAAHMDDLDPQATMLELLDQLANLASAIQVEALSRGAIAHPTRTDTPVPADTAGGSR